MLVIQARNVNYAYYEGLWRMKVMGVPVDTRNGKAMRILGPVATVYAHPTERMLLDVRRDANPFFHIFEGVWMLAGRNDVKWISQFNSNIGQYSDDGKTLRGAYGSRWRNHWEEDQLEWVIDHLRFNPSSRRAVVQMFDPDMDHGEGRDIPCNTGIFFEIVEGRLNMTVTNRSNDLVWGCYGANAVHMSMLQEFIANALGVSVGVYTQISNNFHIYEGHFPLLDVPAEPRPYTTDMAEAHVPLASAKTWQDDLREFESWIEHPNSELSRSPFVQDVLNPMLTAWNYYKVKNKDTSLLMAATIKDPEIRVTCYEWLQRRNWEKTE